MSLLRFLGLSKGDAASAADETATVRRISDRLDRLEPEAARFLAAFAYVLARVANADLSFAQEETEWMHDVVRELGELSDGEAELVVEIAKSQAKLLGGTENYVVTREFRKLSTRAQRGRLLDCLFGLAAADGSISGDENREILAIGEELGFTRPEVNALRSRYRDKLSIFQKE